jgi:ribosomal protein S18 acetylase RimI-like enzyme
VTELERVGTTEPEVLRLYAEFVEEADGELGLESSAETGKPPPADLEPPDGALMLARISGEPVGLAGVRHLDTDVAKVKSMYVVPAHRHRGLGGTLLREVERIAAERGCSCSRLDTSDYLTDAIRLYRSAGYREVPDYNGNPKANLWFERRLD